MSRRTGETGGVLSFTFLDVLTCTMGSLVLLVVVLGQRAKDVRLDEALKHQGTGEIAKSAPKSPEAKALEGPTAEDAQKKLAELKAQQAELDKLRAQAVSRANDEQDRVSHLEEHERRLEHELAQLQITLDRLEEAEGKQNVDESAAEQNLKRLKQLLVDSEKELDGLRKNGGGKKSYAIVPYKGANGTFRQPIYIECTKEAVTIQPEGIQLKAIDFDGPVRSGNPLAAAMRAAREELNARARAAGKADLPEPYPLVIVRPDGANAYAAAVSAIGAWDADYGYEFVPTDWKLEFPDSDPKLNQVMQHAVEQARDRQAMLAKVAPRRYGSRLSAAGQGGSGGGGGSDEGDGFDVITEGGPGDRIGQNGTAGYVAAGGQGDGRGGSGGGSGRGSSSRGGGDEDFAKSVAESARYGEMQGSGNGAANGQTGASQAAAGSSPGGAGSETAALAGQQQSSMGASGSTAKPGEASLAAALDANGAASPGQQGGAAAGVSGGGTNTGSGPSGGNGSSASASSAASSAGGGGSAMAGAAPGGASASGSGGSSANIQLGTSSSRDAHSAAEKRGANWANAEASRRSSPITRPIQVLVRPDEIDILNDDGPASQKPQVVTFHQPTDRVLDQVAIAVQQHIKDWGLAGQGMYWRPTLVLQVAPGADRHAIRLNDLLKDSGVDVRFKDVASKPEEASRATR